MQLTFGGLNKHVINISFHIHTHHIFEEFVDHHLKDRLCIEQSEGHDLATKHVCVKCCVNFICKVHHNLLYLD